MAVVMKKSILLASLLLLLLLLAAAAAAAAAVVWASGDGDGGEESEELPVEEEFERWMVLHQRKYEDEREKMKRLQIFKKNKEYVDNFNRGGNHTYTLGINGFSDLTDEEFANMYLSETDDY